MKALASKSSDKSSVKSASYKQAVSTPKANSFSTTHNSDFVIQRKPGCPCGGGCPSCKEEATIQTKLKIGEPNDKYEQEADRVAEQVMRMPDRQVSGISKGPAKIQRKCASCESGHEPCPECAKEEEFLQAKEKLGHTPEGTSQIIQNIHTLRGSGQPLPQSTRKFFEPRFGHDFSQVRVHTDTAAAGTAQAVSARAFTLGKDVVFGTGQYSPNTRDGKKLLAHELTHVIQQQGMGTSSLQRLTEVEKTENLKSPKYAGNPRLEKAFDNAPSLGIGETSQGVRLVQEGLVADGFAMPGSTKPTGELDGGFGGETFKVVKEFQIKHGLAVDGVVGRETMGKLDELASPGQPLQICADPDDVILEPANQFGFTGAGLTDVLQSGPGGCFPLQVKKRGVKVTGDIALVRQTFATMCPDATFIVSGDRILADKCPLPGTGSKKHGCTCLCIAIFQGKFEIIVLTSVSNNQEPKTLHTGATDELPFPSEGPNTDGNIVTLWHPTISTFKIGAFDDSGNRFPAGFLRTLGHELCGHGVANGRDGTLGNRPFHDETIEVENQIAGENNLRARGKFKHKRQGESFFKKDGDPNSVFRLGDDRPKEGAPCSAPNDEDKCWHFEPI